MARYDISIIKFIHRWRKRARPQQRWELHESLWSWLLFWQQFMGLMHALLKRFMAIAIHPGQVTAYPLAKDRQILTIHNIYEIYRSFLDFAASQGYPRANYETPNEFSVRLEQHYPLLTSHLAMITSAYVTTRYTGTTLKPEDISATHSAWIAVQQSWQ